MLYIGIDPGENNGVAGWNSRDEILFKTATMKFWDVIELLREYGHPKPSEAFMRPDIKVIIENPGLNKPVFMKKGANNQGAMQRVAQNVGMNKAYAKLIIEYCEKYGIPYIAVKPTTAKWDQKYFEKVTKRKEKVSQHVRDAVKLVWGI